MTPSIPDPLPSAESGSHTPGPPHRDKWRVVRNRLRAIIIAILGVALVMMNPFRAVNAKVEIDAALLESGVVYTVTPVTIHEQDGVTIVVSSSAQVPWDLKARIRAFSNDDRDIGSVGWVRLGESLNVPGLGDFYLIELFSRSGEQMVRILFIPEPE